MILAIIAAWLAYKKAKIAKRNAILWAFITAGAFIGTQAIVSIGLSVFIEIVVQSTKISDSYGNVGFLITGLSLVASFIVMWRILLFLDGVPEEKPFTPPPSPPTFD